MGFLNLLGPYISPIIHILAAFCFASYVCTRVYSNNINNISFNSTTPSHNEKGLTKASIRGIRFTYSFFLTSLTLFPLLGMFGTVLALLRLDLVNQPTETLKQSFFIALDTTAWGLLYSICFKLLHAFGEVKIEAALEKLQKIKNNKIAR